MISALFDAKCMVWIVNAMHPYLADQEPSTLNKDWLAAKERCSDWFISANQSSSEETASSI